MKKTDKALKAVPNGQCVARSASCGIEPQSASLKSLEKSVRKAFLVRPAQEVAAFLAN